ncbi:MAG: hypothetical protein EBT52_00200 [Flavobacteriia bacterium]|nr:hypothetical protein [Flavobacteriia bacterium]
MGARTGLIRLLIGCVWMSGCTSAASEKQCRQGNSDEILLKGEIGSPIYQNVLLAHLEAYGESAHFYFLRRTPKDHVLLRVEGDSFCGYLDLAIQDEDEQSQKLQNASGYSGAEIQKLQFEQIADQAYWVSAGRIID